MRVDNRKALPVEYNWCPTECLNAVKKFDLSRVSYCVDCPHKKEREEFKAEYDEIIFDVFGRFKAKKFPFEKMLSVLYFVMNTEENFRGSVKTFIMKGVYLSEEQTADAVREKNKPT